MKKDIAQILKSRCTKKNFDKLKAVRDEQILSFLGTYVSLCDPDSIFVKTDAPADSAYIRRVAIQKGEEKALHAKGHVVHFDGIGDQGRDKAATKYLLTKDARLGKSFNFLPRPEGVGEITDLLRGSMRGKEMIVCFFGLGPLHSPFFIPCVQLTDSFYVAHSENILYRSAYDAIRGLRGKPFFKFVHSAGELEKGVSRNVTKRRVYIDIKSDTVYSVNTQYAGNTVGLKKLALRLAIRKASREGWLAEHMFIMGVKGPAKRVTYFCGAYPSACGKTSTAMISGESIVGDDIAYLRKIKGSLRAANVECGIFGIITDVHKKSDPLIWKTLTNPGEVIFSNILVGEDNLPYWIGDKRPHPARGVNFSGPWFRGKIDGVGNEIPCAHKNARYTISLRKLANCDPHLDTPAGVEVGAIIYGGRDSDTWPPLQESLNWLHGVITMGASLESETTAATLGKEGVRTFNLMSNLDFLSIPIGEYIKNHINFTRGLKKIPLIFSVNYFLRDENGLYLSEIEDKRVWLKWMELRVHGEVGAIKTPTGFIPYYLDLKNLFKAYLDKDYPLEIYYKQFTLRVPQNLAKIERIANIYRENISQCPRVIFRVLEEQKTRLIEFGRIHGDYIDPLKLEAIVKGNG